MTTIDSPSCGTARTIGSGTDQPCRNVHLQQRKIAFAVNRDHAADREFLAVEQMYLGPCRVFNNVLIGDDPVDADKKAAASCNGVALSVKCFDRDRRRFDPFNELRQKILRRNISGEKGH